MDYSLYSRGSWNRITNTNTNGISSLMRCGVVLECNFASSFENLRDAIPGVPARYV